MSFTCAACLGDLTPEGLDLASLPLSHDLSSEPSATPRRIPFHLVQCQSCALVQTLICPPAVDLVPRGEWVAFTEPSLHLDDLAAKILSIANITESSTIVGLSSKDDSLLKMLAAPSGAMLWRVNPAEDVGFIGNSAGVAWIQDAFDSALAKDLRETRGGADLLVARHFLEHVSQIPRAVYGMKELLKQGGHVVIEVPDCEAGLQLGDDSILWEEHRLCFTASTLKRSLRLAGFEVIWSSKYSLPNETCLIAIATPCPSDSGNVLSPLIEEFDCFSSFVSAFPERCRCIRQFLEQWRAQGKIAIYGAGHHASSFIHAHEVAGLIDYVIDDNPHKTGKYMPDTAIQIIPANRLRFPEVSLCLSSLGFSAERRVVAASDAFSDAGGAFYSIFSGNNGSPFRWLSGTKLPTP